ncbi:bifunctional 2-C-methyl-D-erythritol 4-phosphate cytidylyltransferase/2-C-methyl-D-erythritol 2,4-cyclodiphosphate synthase [Sphingomonas lacunae]|uniref:Bifunctional enzyme IspD/IspF n=1 Tax=Sphingomonas lacunae TaxID=2698828 RepID=A0A6M4AVJ4_9SPHN|nr:bifunctional 2-C-methyl-D-erythritol 4-phosphate cytidylyltransferase/2-C-methyl-D-erythritol 2,4-cyclodiphosphate synthase [Sphingomonas lacunae]QJQ33125.1 bifunctional 2-C-methyl-D-erythritol 4-phosphate cytidylyltransferase/2-C-methyl-D-erythritol 2,4-cyclodiphosphate synthase [Sphingomonas lacunae]
MMQQNSFHAVIVAGGRGERAGLSVPKQYALLGGKAVVRWSAEAMLSHPLCAGLTIVIPPGDEARAMAEAALSGLTLCWATGGDSRQASVAAGLAGLDEELAGLVLVHDAARPGLDSATIDRLLTAFADATVDGAVPVLPVADTLALCGPDLGDVVDRSALVRVQTPQAFRLTALRAAHAGWQGASASDDAQMIRALGRAVAMVEGRRELEKVTHQGDLEQVEAMLCPAPRAGQWRTAVGMGFDVHRLIDGDGVWLGGLLIPHDRKLEGHSDADVLLHAITDAVLGGIGDGDIGQHFPPSDPQWRGASSDRFLAHACELVAACGGRIEHVDATVMCEAPKVGPHRQAIRERIAAIMGLPVARVSIKATTTERLGFTGRGEGIAAQAVVTVRLPDGGDNQ